MEKRIAVIFTGGTIGSVTREGVIGLDEGAPDLLLEQYTKRYGDKREFKKYYPVSVLSENMTPYEFGKIAECLSLAAKEEDVAGIILTHGTDTLTFTANALAVMFSDISVPVVIVSSFKPLTEGGNGVQNFKAAVDFISLEIPGVFVAYQNFKEPMRIHLGARLAETEQLTARVSSIGNLHFASLEGGRFVLNSSPKNVSLKSLSEPKKPSGLTSLSTDVVTVVPHTGTDFEYYLLKERIPRAYVIKLYHSGTCSGVSGKFGVMKFIERAREEGSEVVLAPFPSGMAKYESSGGIFDKALIATDISFEMCVVKVMLALGSGVGVSEALSRNYAFEKLI